MRRLLGNLAVSLASLLIFLVLCEAVLRVVSPPPRPGLPKDMFGLNAQGYWQMAPNFSGLADNRVDYRDKRVTADERGQRIVPAAPGDAPWRIFTIGDSQTFGHGLSDEESWPNQLQAALGDGVKVENHGIPAVNVDQYAVRLKAILPQIKRGDVVAIGLSWNDLITPQSLAAEQIRVVEGYLVKAGTEDATVQARRIRLLEATGVYVPPLSDVKAALEALSQHSALVHFLYPRAKAIYYRLRRHRPVESLVANGVPDANMAILAGMREKVATAGARFVVVLLPDKIFFEDRAWEVYSVGGRDYADQNLMGALATPLCHQFALACLDAFELLHAHQHEPVAFPIDGHYNESGARLIGRWLADRLRS